MQHQVIESRQVTRDGIAYDVSVVDDYDVTPDEYDCYSPSDVAAFKRGDWQYVGVVVRPSIDRVGSAGVQASLWGVEFGTMPAETEPWQGGQHDETVCDLSDDGYIMTEVVPDLISEARAELETLARQITHALAA